MKKLLLSGLLIVICSSVYAQEDNNELKNKTTFGVKGGLNFSYLASPNNEGLIGEDFYGGFFSETRLNKKWSFQSELLYSNSIYYRFVEIPLSLKYHINDKWSVFGGVSLDFSIDDRNIEDSTIESLGLSAVLGTQYNFSDKFFIEGRFNLGITNQINKLDNNNYNSYTKHLFRIGLGYRF